MRAIRLLIDLRALERFCVNAGDHAGKVVYIAHTLELSASGRGNRESEKRFWRFIRSAISRAFFSSRLCSAFSISVSTSPMPRIREAIRSGWNGSI